jgi:hypothetical protein
MRSPRPLPRRQHGFAAKAFLTNTGEAIVASDNSV